MRNLLIVTLVALGLTLAGCTEAQREDAGEEGKEAVDAAGSELKEAVEEVDLEAAAEKTKEVATEATAAVKDVAGDVKEGVDRADQKADTPAEETRDAAK